MSEDQRTTLYLVRHGETDWNVKKIIQGSSDIPLNAIGEQQAKELGKKLRHTHFDLIFSSDLLRAKRTAELIKLERALEIQAKEVLRERNNGIFEGVSYEEYNKNFGELINKLQDMTIEQRWNTKFHPEIESDQEIYLRINPFLRELCIANPGKNILVVAHGAILRSFLAHLDQKYYDLGFENTGYVKILSDGIDFEVVEEQGLVSRNGAHWSRMK